jgi:DNA-binding GntR family transcriptional regulator
MTQRAGAGQAKYKAIADDLRARMTSGEYQVGDMLPTQDELMKRYSAALGTVREALGELREAGLAETHQGVGTVVVEPPVPEPAPQYTALMQQITELAAEVRRLNERMDAHDRRVADGSGQ